MISFCSNCGSPFFKTLNSKTISDEFSKQWTFYFQFSIRWNHWSESILLYDVVAFKLLQRYVFNATFLLLTRNTNSTNSIKLNISHRNEVWGSCHSNFRVHLKFGIFFHMKSKSRTIYSLSAIPCVCVMNHKLFKFHNK
jgi:hypothetical protein